MLLLAFWKNQPFRSFVQRLDARVLISVHLTRFVGIYFLFLTSRGHLPKSFATSAGWGHIAAATGALALLFWPSPGRVLAWNVFGFGDILFVVIKAAAQFLSNRDSMEPFTRLPLSFLPTMVVPLILFTHVVLFLRLRGRAWSAPASDQSGMSVISFQHE